MPEVKVTIRNKAGIHCRPSSVIMTEKENFPGVEFRIVSDNGTAELNSILELLALGLQCGDEITLSATGENAEKALEVMSELFAREFDFPPRNDGTAS